MSSVWVQYSYPTENDLLFGNPQSWKYTAREHYRDCPDNPNGDNHKIMALDTLYCAEKLDNLSYLYMVGFKFNILISNNNNVDTDPNDFDWDWYQGFGSKGTVKCATHNHINSPWMYMSSHPWWSCTGWIRNKKFSIGEYLNREEIFWSQPDGNRKFFHPSTDYFTGDTFP